MGASSLPSGQKVIGIRLVFQIRHNNDESFEKFNARFVAQRFSLVFRSDYIETFAPTAELCALRICFALAASWSTFVFQLDVRSAFIANLNDKIYIEQPKGFALVGAYGGKLYWNLQKCLYGLKWAGREWNKTLYRWFLKNSFVQSAEDQCLFRCDGTNCSHFLELVWVDDFLDFSSSDKMLHAFEAKLSDAFSINDRGDITWFFECNIEQQRARISLIYRTF